VELTANPAEHWLFDHWEGDMTGKDNPAKLTVSSAKSVKAVFVKPLFAFNVKIVGNGVVNESLVEETKGTIESGKRVKFVAVPSDGFVFDGWEGGLTGKDPSVITDIDSDKEIIASFSKKVKQYPLPDLKSPWVVRKSLFADADFTGLTNDAADLLAVDYNLDGYVDVVTTVSPEGEWISDDCPIRFYLGGANGNFIPDERLNNLGLIAKDPRKTMYGELNGDGIPDFILVGHGYDAEPWPGESPVIVLSDNKNGYSAHTLTETVGYYHGSTTGDFDNDGDLDIFLLEHRDKSRMLVNDGQGNFTLRDDLVNNEVIMGGMYSTEFFDVDHDGFLDLVVAGHEQDGPFEEKYKNTTCVFWGNGKDYNGEYTRLPRFVDGYGVTLDFAFFDIDNDGQEEMIEIRTGDGYLQPCYVGWKARVIDVTGREFKEVTSDYISEEDDGSPNDGPVLWIDVEILDDGTFLCGRQLDNGKKLFEIKNGTFIRCEVPKSFNEGVCIYSDGAGFRETYLDLGFSKDTYNGSTCMKFSNWETWRGWSVNYTDFYNFSELEKNGYCLEFAIKNNDPDLWIDFAFETRLQTDPWYFPSYHYLYDAHQHKSDGTWEIIQVPLSSLKCEDEWTGYYWNTIKTINIMPGECHGKDFYLDEIRIRKIIQ